METALKTEEEKREYFDSPEQLDVKVDEFVKMLKTSKHFIAFTGAGISTSAGIPDFRSGVNTVLPTGPGCWEKRSQGLKQNLIKSSVMLQALPTKTHMSLVALERKDLLKFLVSQNGDGLHRRSGFHPDKLAELHGNTNVEICGKCKKKYLRDFQCRTARKVFEHGTPRKCDNAECGGDLFDNIINFGEGLPEKELNDSFEHAEEADLCLALGSSLKVTPAADIPHRVSERKKNLVIVNLQKTPLDEFATLRVNALCDDFMEKVMKKMEIEILEFILTRRFKVQRIQDNNKKTQILFKGCDKGGAQYTIFKSISVEFHQKITLLEQEPFIFADPFLDPNEKEKVTVILQFFGRYGEPNYKLEILCEEILKKNNEHKYIVEYSPRLGKWIKCLVHKIPF